MFPVLHLHLHPHSWCHVATALHSCFACKYVMLQQYNIGLTPFFLCLALITQSLQQVGGIVIRILSFFSPLRPSRLKSPTGGMIRTAR